MPREDREAAERALTEVHDALANSGGLVPLELGGADERRWLDCELASFAENRIGDRTDPWEIDRSTRERWRARVLEEPLRPPRARTSGTCYWLVRGNRRVGTIALSRFCLGTFAIAYSVYIRPPYRDRGLMAQALRAVHGELEVRGLGLQLETLWTWQHAVHFYLRLGFWCRLWKRDLGFSWPPHASPPILDVGEREASIAVALEGRPIVVARARRAARWLVAFAEEPNLPASLRDRSWDARTTLALAIALHGWPLVRSKEKWEHSRYSDAVHPEGLANRIMVWEAWAARHGWRSDAPRIAGLEYPTWAELEARWKAAEERYLKRSGH